MASNNNEIFGVQQKTPYQMDQPEIMRMTVVIRLSGTKHIPSVRSSLKKVLPDMDFEDKGKEITVSAYPPNNNFGEDNVLAIVQKLDPSAQKIRKPSAK